MVPKCYTTKHQNSTKRNTTIRHNCPKFLGLGRKLRGLHSSWQTATSGAQLTLATVRCWSLLTSPFTTTLRGGLRLSRQFRPKSPRWLQLPRHQYKDRRFLQTSAISLYTQAHFRGTTAKSFAGCNESSQG
jgi:hypothetical protein